MLFSEAEMIALISVVLIIFCAGCCFFWWHRRVGIERVPGPKPRPIFGNALQVDKKKTHVTLYQWANVYGDVYQLDMLGVKYLILNSPELFDSVLTRFTNRPYSIVKTLTYNGSGVDFSNREFIINEMKRALHDIALDEALRAILNTEAKTFVHGLQTFHGNDVEVNAALRKATALHIMISLLGRAPEETNLEAFEKFIKVFGDLFAGSAAVLLTSMPCLRFVPGPLKRDYDKCKMSIERLVDGLLQIIREGKGSGHGMIETLIIRKRHLEDDIENKEKLTDDNICGFILDALIGSIVPVAHNMIGIILCILKHPSVQDKLHAELDQVCASNPPNEMDRDKLHYLNATLLEGFRYLSMLSVTVPHTNTEDSVIDGYVVEKGTQIFGNIFCVHHDDRTWGDSWVFRPERFLDSSGHLLPSDHLLRKSVKTFGTGPRMCKGYDIAERAMFMYIANIMYYFNVLSPAGGVLPDCDPRTFEFAAALIPPVVRCRFEPRLNASLFKV